jgi:hypothetical protein
MVETNDWYRQLGPDQRHLYDLLYSDSSCLKYLLHVLNRHYDILSTYKVWSQAIPAPGGRREESLERQNPL